MTTESTENSEARDRELTGQIISSASSVHRELGPGLLESIYSRCFAFDLASCGFTVEAEKSIPLVFKGLQFETGFRADIIVEGRVLLELKAVEQLLPVHTAQVLSYLKLTSLRTALLINFNVPVLKDGIKRISL